MKIKKWISQVEDEIKFINESKPKDRLDYISSIDRFNSALLASSAGWEEWIKHATIMNEFTVEEIEEIFKEFQALSSRLLNFDVKWTKKLTSKLKIKDTEEFDISKEGEDCEHTNPKKDNKFTNDNTSYIA